MLKPQDYPLYFSFFLIFWQVHAVSSKSSSSSSRPSRPRPSIGSIGNSGVVTSSSGSAGNHGYIQHNNYNSSTVAFNYYENPTDYNVTYYGNYGGYGPVIYYGYGDNSFGDTNGFHTPYDDEMHRLTRTTTTTFVLIFVLIFVICLCGAYLFSKNENHKTHGDLGSREGHVASSSIPPTATFLGVVECNNGHLHQDKSINYENNDIFLTDVPGHHNGHPVSCVSAFKDAPTSVVVG